MDFLRLISSRSVLLRSLMAALWLALDPVRGADPEFTIEQHKAAVLLRFSEFTTRPAASEVAADRAPVIGFVNAPGMLAAARAFVASDPKDLTVIREIQTTEEAARCESLYFGRLDESALKILSGVQTQPVLTVGEGLEFIRASGIVGFAFRTNRTGGRIEYKAEYYVSLEAMKRAQVVLHSRIIKNPNRLTAEEAP